MRSEYVSGRQYRVLYDDYRTMTQPEFIGVYRRRTEDGYYVFEMAGEEITLKNPMIREVQSDA